MEVFQHFYQETQNIITHLYIPGSPKKWVWQNFYKNMQY